MTRALFVATGLTLIAVAFVAGANVADTREGLIAEVIALFAALAGIALLLYGLIPRRRDIRTMPGSSSSDPSGARPSNRRRTANDLVIGTGGMLVALALFTGLAYSGGWVWALLGGALLIPMIAGSAYLVIAFARAPDHEWRIDLRRLFRLGPND